MKNLQAILDRAQTNDGKRIIDDLQILNKLEEDLIIALKPLFDDESAFYEELSDILKKSLLGKKPSDSSQHLFSTERPFPQSDEDFQEQGEFTFNNDDFSGSENQNVESRSAFEEETKFFNDQFQD